MCCFIQISGTFQHMQSNHQLVSMRLRLSRYYLLLLHWLQDIMKRRKKYIHLFYWCQCKFESPIDLKYYPLFPIWLDSSELASERTSSSNTVLTTLLALYLWQTARQRCRPNVKKYSLMFSWVQAEQAWLKGVSEKQIKGDKILSGNSHHSNQTLSCIKSSSKPFHCVSFPCRFCYNRYVWRTSAAVNCGSTGLFPMGLCVVFHTDTFVYTWC